MALLHFRRKEQPGAGNGALAGLLAGASIEVMPRTLAKLADPGALLAPGTRVYIAHIAGTPIEEMVAAAARLAAAGFEPMPHFPARIIPDRATLADWIARYRGEADVRAALVLAGGVAEPAGEFADSMQLLDTGLFDDFARLHVAGHPEGNRDIDPEGGEARVMAALGWKQEFAAGFAGEMAIVTQFAFEAGPVIAWEERLRAAGITLPVHLGVAGPAKLQTLIRYAIACGVGPSLRVLQRRAMDVTRLLTPYEPTEFLGEIAAHVATHPDCLIRRVHFFPLGGIAASADWLNQHRGAAATPERAAPTRAAATQDEP